jgi:hypothetical protein
MNKNIFAVALGCCVFFANCTNGVRETLSPVDDDGSMGRKSFAEETAGFAGEAGSNGSAGDVGVSGTAGVARN